MFTLNELLKITQGKLISGRSNLSLKGVSIDSRTIRPDELFIAIKGRRYDGHDYIYQAIEKGASAVLTEKPCRLKKEAAVIVVKDTVKSLGKIAAFHRRRFSIPVIGITGSNGKTSTKDLACHLLQSEFCVLKNAGTKNNQIGLPLTLLKLNKKHQIAVLEMGTNHRGEIRRLSSIAAPNIGIILNIGQSHLEFLHDLKTVYKEKYELIKNLKAPKVAILNKDDPFLNAALDKTRDNFLISFAIKKKADFQAKRIKIDNAHLKFSLRKRNFKLNTLGGFNAYNVLAALALARIFGIGYSKIALRLSKFNFPAGRLSLKKIKGAIFIDDTYNANPASLNAAIGALGAIKTRKKKIVILGDMLELGRSAKRLHFQAGEQISQFCGIIITVGKLARLAALAAIRRGFDRDAVYICRTVDQAKRLLRDKVRPSVGDVILVKGSRTMKMEEIF